MDRIEIRYVTRYGAGLWRLHEEDDPSGVLREHVEELRDILAGLGFNGWATGFWAVTVRANWPVIFRFAGRDARDVDYVDYH